MKKKQKKPLLKRRTKRKIIRAAAIGIAALTVYGTPFTTTYATEPEQVKTKSGKVIVW